MNSKLDDMKRVYHCYQSMLPKVQEEEARQRAEYERLQGIAPVDNQTLERAWAEVECLLADQMAICTNLEKATAEIMKQKRSENV